jgi:hypothetical protein
MTLLLETYRLSLKVSRIRHEARVQATEIQALTGTCIGLETQHLVRNEFYLRSFSFWQKLTLPERRWGWWWTERIVHLSYLVKGRGRVNLSKVTESGPGILS